MGICDGMYKRDRQREREGHTASHKHTDILNFPSPTQPQPQPHSSVMGHMNKQLFHTKTHTNTAAVSTHTTSQRHRKTQHPVTLSQPLTEVENGDGRGHSIIIAGGTNWDAVDAVVLAEERENSIRSLDAIQHVGVKSIFPARESEGE